MNGSYAGRRVLVTGGAGAIGGHLTRALARAGAQQVVVVDDLSAGLRQNVPDGPEVRFLHGSILDDATLDEAFREPPSVVFHLAALFANQNSVDHPELDLAVNGHGTLALLLRASRSGSERLVYASSSCVPTQEVGAPGELPPGWDTPYQITKGLGEQYCRYFNASSDLTTVMVRFFNSYGPGELPGRYRNVIPNFFHRAIRRQPLPILGSGEETRDWTYVGDIVEGLLACGLAKGAAGEVVSLGTGRETRVIDLAHQINELTGNPAGVTHRERRNWDTHLRRVAPTVAARRLIDHECRTPMSVGLERTAQWFSRHWALIERAAQW